MQKRELRRAVFGDESCIGRLPWLNTAVLVYVGVTVVSFVLLQIAPVLTWMAKTPLYHISTYLGLIGAVLMALDLFTNRGLWRGIWCWLLYGVAFMDVIASLRTMRYGVKDNLFDLCWVVIQFALVYSLAQRVGKERMRRFLRNLFYVVLVIWGIACCVGLYQYLFRIGYTYVANPNTTSPELTRLLSEPPVRPVHGSGLCGIYQYVPVCRLYAGGRDPWETLGGPCGTGRGGAGAGHARDPQRVPQRPDRLDPVCLLLHGAAGA